MTRHRLTAAGNPFITAKDLTDANHWLDEAYERDFRKLSIPPEVAAVLSMLVDRAQRKRMKREEDG